MAILVFFVSHINYYTYTMYGLQSYLEKTSFKNSQQCEAYCIWIAWNSLLNGKWRLFDRQVTIEQIILTIKQR